MEYDVIANNCKFWVDKLEMDLSGLTVITELATGSYSCAGVLPLMAKAKKVIALAKDTKYGSAELAAEQTAKLAEHIGIQTTNLKICDKFSIDDLENVDIILNVGNVRPIDDSLLIHVRQDKVVVGLMYEAWELRDDDINIDICRQKGVRIAGVDESNDLLEIFQGVGILGLKLLLEAGIGILHSKILIWSTDKFGDQIEDVLSKLNADVIRVSSEDELLSNAADSDAVIFCEQSETREIIGCEGVVNILKLKKINKTLKIVHLYGRVDISYAEKHGLVVYPKCNGRSEYMSKTLDYLNPKFSVGLYASGLHAAACYKQSRGCDFLQKVY